MTASNSGPTNGHTTGKNAAALGLITGLTTGAALLGRATTGNPDESRWYTSLKKPPFHPPSWVFGPVWSALYGAMAISAFRVFTKGHGRERQNALATWGVQLALNAAWSYLFFKRRAPRASLADILLLGVSIVGYIRAAKRVDRPAAMMFLPYLGWVAFAALLNEEIVRRNPPSRVG